MMISKKKTLVNIVTYLHVTYATFAVKRKNDDDASKRPVSPDNHGRRPPRTIIDACINGLLGIYVA